MAPGGPPGQEDVIEEQEGKGLSARPCRGLPCGARGPGSVPALTSIGAQMAHRTQLMLILIPGWESMAEQNSESVTFNSCDSDFTMNSLNGPVGHIKQ